MDHCDMLYFIFDTGYVVSPLCLLVHLYKFFAAGKEQNLPSKNLASYCLGTTFACINVIFKVLLPTATTSDQIRNLAVCVDLSCACNSAILLFNMTLDTFLCLRNSVNKLRLSGGERHGMFIAYSVLSWGTSATIFVTTSAILTLKIAELFDITRYIVTFIILVYIGCFFLFCGSLGYLRSKRIGDDRHANNRNATRNVGIRVRLILITGVTYIMWLLIYVAIVIILGHTPWGGKIQLCKKIYRYSMFLPPYEGVFIFFGFTVKKGMFEDNRSRAKNAPPERTRRDGGIPLS